MASAIHSVSYSVESKEYQGPDHLLWSFCLFFSFFFSSCSIGKYLNVVRECGRDVTCPDAKEILYTLKERAYVEQIEKSYYYASKVLLDFLMEEKELVARLR